MDDLTILTECALFHGLREAQIREMLPCLSARQSRFRRGQFLLRAGDRVAFAGILLSGEAEVLQEDFWGNRNLLAAVGPGDLFAEAFACAHAVSPVSVLCKTDGSVLYLNVRAVFSPCEKACAQHKALSQNLIRVLAEKNMQLNEKAQSLFCFYQTELMRTEDHLMLKEQSMTEILQFLSDRYCSLHRLQT